LGALEKTMKKKTTILGILESLGRKDHGFEGTARK
jgi:hypothetical protein